MAAPSATRIRRLPVASLALVSLLMLAACTPRSMLYPDADGFDFETFAQSPTALGGVASGVRAADAGIESPEQLAPLMESAFIGGRKDLRFVPTAVLRERVGEAGYIVLLDRYADDGDLGAAECARLAGALGGEARYLALARIDDAEVSHRTKSQDSDGDRTTDNEDVTKTTERRVWLTFSLFDLQTGREILTEDRVEAATAELTFREAPGPGIYGVLESHKWVLGSREPEFPPAPPMHDAIGRALGYFAKRIPSK